MLITSWMANLLGFLFGTSVISIIFSLVVYALLIRYIFWPLSRWLAPNIISLIRSRSAPLNQTVLLELTPPRRTGQTIAAVNELYASLHQLLLLGSWSDRILRRSDQLSLELVASQAQGIRYLLALSSVNQETIQKLLHSYMPDLRIKPVKDYLPARLDDPKSPGRLIQYTQAGHYAYPLKAISVGDNTDPIHYLLGSMTKLAADELVVWQLVLAPDRSSSAGRLARRLQAGYSISFSSTWWASPLRLLFWSGRTLLETIGLLTGNQQLIKHPAALPVSPLDSRNQALDKLAQPLFRTDIRLLLLTTNPDRAAERIKTLQSALALFANNGWQALRQRLATNLPLVRSYRFWQFKNRTSSLLPADSSLLATTEIASLWHFPYDQIPLTEDLAHTLARTLPAPLTMKNKPTAVILGRNCYQGVTTPIGLTASERQRHVYIIGGTGNGKTTMLQYAIVQDIQKGKGVAVIDPHGDSASSLLKYIPQNRLSEVIYFNPGDYDYPIGLNLLELPPGLSGSQLAHQKDVLTEALISVLRKIFDERSEVNAYRIERILRNAIHTALTIEGATIFTVLRLLTDRNYRNAITRQLTDISLKHFWQEELNKAGDMQRIKLSGGPIARIERFERSESARRVLGQAHSTINFEEIINDGKILICNFSKGRLGEDTSALFGTAVLAKLQLAAWQREDIEPTKRRPFYVYVDEFQNFANESFLSILTESRKYKLFLTLAEQSTAQQDHQLIEVMLNNIGTVVCFRTGSPQDERLLLHTFGPLIEAHEITNLPAYNFYIRIAAEQVYEPFSGETILLANTGSKTVAEQVKAASRKNYATYYQPAELKPLPRAKLKVRQTTPRRSDNKPAAYKANY